MSLDSKIGLRNTLVHDLMLMSYLFNLLPFYDIRWSIDFIFNHKVFN